MLTIRLEEPLDEAEIQELLYEAFLHHPHHAPGALPNEHLLVEKLRQSHALFLSLVALHEGQLVGVIIFSKVSIDAKDLGWVGLGPVAVRKSMQGQGVGSALICEALAQLEKRSVRGVVLLGEPEYYRRFGFAPDSRLTLPGVPPEYFLVRPFGQEIPNGAVTYHPAFEA